MSIFVHILVSILDRDRVHHHHHHLFEHSHKSTNTVVRHKNI